MAKRCPDLLQHNAVGEMKAAPAHPRSMSMLQAIEQLESQRKRKLAWANVCSCRRSCGKRSTGQPQAVLAPERSIWGRVADTMLALKDAQPEALNDFSFECFLSRCVHFIVALALLLRGGDWSMSMGCSATMGQGLALTLHLYRLITRWRDMRAALARGVPSTRYLDTAAEICGICSSLASLVPGMVGFAVLISPAYPRGPEFLLYGLVACGAVEALCTAVLAGWSAWKVAQAYRQAWSTWACIRTMCRAVGLVGWRVALVRSGAWHSAAIAAAAVGITKMTGSTAQAGSDWTKVLLVVVYLHPVLFLCIAVLCFIGWLTRTTVYHTEVQEEEAIRRAEQHQQQAAGTSSIVRAEPIRRQDELRIKSTGKTVLLLASMCVSSTLMAGASFLLVREMRMAVEAFAKPGLPDAAAAYGMLSRRDVEAVRLPSLSLTGSQLILAWWLLLQLMGMASLVLMARTLQDAWDAEDDMASSSLVNTESQQAAADRTRREIVRSGGRINNIPLFQTLEKISEGVYRRTQEDTKAKAMGIQIVGNPIHHLKDVAAAVARRTEARARSASQPTAVEIADAAEGQAIDRPVVLKHSGNSGMRTIPILTPVPAQSQHMHISVPFVDTGMRSAPTRVPDDAPSFSRHLNQTATSGLGVGLGHKGGAAGLTIRAVHHSRESVLSCTVASLDVRIHDGDMHEGHSTREEDIEGEEREDRHIGTGGDAMVRPPRLNIPKDAEQAIPAQPANQREQKAAKGPVAAPVPPASRAQGPHPPPLRPVRSFLGHGALVSPVAGMAATLGMIASLSGVTVHRASSFMGSTSGEAHFHGPHSRMAGSTVPRTPTAREPRQPCFICFDNPADCVMMECGHAGCCMTCARQVAHTSGICPVCRAPVAQLLRVGPDLVAADGVTVAMILPDSYWPTKQSVSQVEEP